MYSIMLYNASLEILRNYLKYYQRAKALQSNSPKSSRNAPFQLQLWVLIKTKVNREPCIKLLIQLFKTGAEQWVSLGLKSITPTQAWSISHSFDLSIYQKRKKCSFLLNSLATGKGDPLLVLKQKNLSGLLFLFCLTHYLLSARRQVCRWNIEEQVPERHWGQSNLMLNQHQLHMK